MELWDLCNEKREFLNKTHVRGENMISGQYHVVVAIWTINSKNEILVTLRDPNKDCYADMWENTAGSALAGETSREGAARELYEETGIKVREEELNLLGTLKEKSAFVDTYIIRKDISIDDLTMQKGETVDAKWVTIEELDNMIKGGDVAGPVAERLSKLRSEFEDFIAR